MINVHWLEQTEADLPAGNNWLSTSEVIRLDGMRFAKRRADWRLGRWTAKRALAAYLNMPSHPQTFTDIELRPAQSGAPQVFVADEPAAVTISLSHRAGVAACAVAVSGVELGCDLEVIEPRSDAFIADYFTTEEQQLIERVPATERPRLLTLLWSGKESALKALRTGLRLDTRSVTVRPAPPLAQGDWHPLQAVCEGGQTFHGWWQDTDNLLRTMVASPPPVPPILLETTVPATRPAS
jgi:4'-phosphopantetheinyl transferase